jgi:hypothetical protein
MRRSGLVWLLPWTHNGGGTHEKGLPRGATQEEGGQPRGGLVWFGAYLGLTMVAAHMKKASPEAQRRKREASQESLVWFGVYLGKGRPATRRSGLVWC